MSYVFMTFQFFSNFYTKSNTIIMKIWIFKNKFSAEMFCHMWKRLSFIFPRMMKYISLKYVSCSSLKISDIHTLDYETLQLSVFMWKKKLECQKNIRHCLSFKLFDLIGIMSWILTIANIFVMIWHSIYYN